MISNFISTTVSNLHSSDFRFIMPGLSRLFLPPDVQVLSVAAVSKKPKVGYLTQGEIFTVSMYLLVLFFIFQFYLSFNLAVP